MTKAGALSAVRMYLKAAVKKNPDIREDLKVYSGEMNRGYYKWKLELADHEIASLSARLEENRRELSAARARVRSLERSATKPGEAGRIQAGSRDCR